jgi:hypothetical protein
LAFVREAVVGDAEEALDGDLDTDFFESLANGALFERLEEVEFAADDAPPTGFGRALAEGEKDAATVVGEEDADADFGCGEIGLRHRFTCE